MVAISSTGLFTPAYSISNKELITSFNRYVAKFNDEHADEIASGTLDPLLPSSEEFVEKASGIKSRYVIEKEQTLDPDKMVPHIPERSNEQISILAEIALEAAQDALQAANKQAVHIDGVLVACCWRHHHRQNQHARVWLCWDDGESSLRIVPKSVEHRTHFGRFQWRFRCCRGCRSDRHGAGK